jgi:3-dehydro-L-gulonate 2-dehydrogenase
MFAICWTNTGRNLPAWGSTNGPLGNNPLVLAVPRRSGHIVLDMAMSQFSYGQLAAYAKRGESLPVPGGFDTEGRLSHDGAAIELSQRPLPIGFWKGSGLSLTLDLFASMLSGGRSSHQVPAAPLEEAGLSQFFLVIDPSNLRQAEDLERTAEALIEALHAAPRARADRAPRYPGEETARLREENLRLGVPVEPSVWAELKAISRPASNTDPS